MWMRTLVALHLHSGIRHRPWMADAYRRQNIIAIRTWPDTRRGRLRRHPYDGPTLVLHPASNIACNTPFRSTRALPCDQPVWSTEVPARSIWASVATGPAIDVRRGVSFRDRAMTAGGRSDEMLAAAMTHQSRRSSGRG